MKCVLLTIIGIVGLVGIASGSNDLSYTATGSPGATPDGVDQNNNPVDVWTEVLTLGGTNGTGDNGEDGSGVYFGNPDGSGGIGGTSENSWQEYSYQNDGVGLGGSANAYNTFAGGALLIGQTVSLNFVMRATDPATDGRPAGKWASVCSMAPPTRSHFTSMAAARAITSIPMPVQQARAPDPWAISIKLPLTLLSP